MARTCDRSTTGSPTSLCAPNVLNDLLHLSCLRDFTRDLEGHVPKIPGRVPEAAILGGMLFEGSGVRFGYHLDIARLKMGTAIPMVTTAYASSTRRSGMMTVMFAFRMTTFLRASAA